MDSFRDYFLRLLKLDEGGLCGEDVIGVAEVRYGSNNWG